MHGVNDHRDVMSEHLQQQLVDLCRGRLAAHEVAELPLDRAEGGFGVAAAMVDGQKLSAFEAVVVKQPIPCLVFRVAPIVAFDME